MLSKCWLVLENMMCEVAGPDQHNIITCNTFNTSQAITTIRSQSIIYNSEKEIDLIVHLLVLGFRAFHCEVVIILEAPGFRIL